MLLRPPSWRALFWILVALPSTVQAQVSAAGKADNAQPAAAKAAGASPKNQGAGDEHQNATATQARAQTHFQNGVKLYQDKNFSGALAEFEAAYELKPGFSSLQNVALCLKALFRYTEAADALRRALSQHAATLSAAEKAQAQSAIDELAALVGTLRLTLTPSDAHVSVDGRELTALERARGVALNVGEHTVSAEAPGYAPASRVVRLASQELSQVPLTLQPTHGFLVVESDHAETSISVDGVAQGLGHWSGPLSPGRHVVTLARPNQAASEQTIDVALGETAHVKPPSAAATPAGSVSDSAASEPGAAVAPRGWYGLLGLGALRSTVQPQGFGAAKDVSAATLGLRGGYRRWAPLGVELVLELGSETASGGCGAPCAQGSAKYTLGSGRLGVNARLMSRGENLRFTGTLGFGVVSHTFTIDSAPGNLPGGKAASASAGYAACELGAQYNARHLLLELDALLFLDGVQNLNGALFGAPAANIFGDRKILPFLGVGVKVGLSEWAPARPNVAKR